ncbi:uncharacterized protein LOC128550842 [Mercenaria mercenaria]|uniref:uncharacterized protein LOC128550842 n=1 Tax=Mercenaria mercenaria TaxID=6596 RepID=UPI00234F4AC7|nr:uncharacterized protein LOC128550842 [Mercenaria mercenaria]
MNCNACQEETSSSSSVCYCKECNEYLCQRHLDDHKVVRFTRNHVTVSVSEGIQLNEEQRKISIQGSAQQMPEQFQIQVNIGQPQAGRQMRTPGKPEIQHVTADTISLSWEKPHLFGKDDTYQLSFKFTDDPSSKWKPYVQEFKTNKATLTDLKSNTPFTFRVRVLFDEEEGPYSPPSDRVQTKQTPAIRIKDFAVVVEKNKVPETRSLPITQVRESRNSEAMTQKFEFGEMKNNFRGNEKTIMLVGETGTGKSTMLNGMVNFVLGVNFDDPVRYTIVHMEDEEKKKHQNQALSQTDWITCYTLYPEEGGRVDFTLNIIDTPGFGDTRGHKRDRQLVKQIHTLFSCRDVRGVLGIDAVCFLIKAPDARLTPTQTYIFESIMSLFGKNVEKNICSLITFADGESPPVLASLKQSGLPFGQHFTFNNSALFTKNTDLGPSSLSPIYWNMGIKSFRAFFDHLSKMHTTSLEQTKDVLDTRQNLETTIQNLLPMVDVGLSTLASMRKQIEFIKQHKLDIEQNKDFLIPREYPNIKQHDTEPGQFVTNCLQCNRTCHKYCAFSDNEDKKYCCAMSGDNCTQCQNKCHWRQHKNMSFYFEIEIETKLESFADKKLKYEEATGKRLNSEGVVKEMHKEIVKIKKEIQEMMKTITSCNNKLKEIAIRQNPLSLVQQIELLIESELSQKRKGFEDRVKELQLYKKEAQYGDVVQHFCIEESSVSEELAEQVVKDEPGFFQNIYNKIKGK